MPKKARSRQLPGKVRQAFEKALEQLKASGTINDLADLWEQMIAENPFKAFETLAKFCPKEMLIEEEVTHHFISGEPMSIEEWEKQYLEGPPIETTH